MNHCPVCQAAYETAHVRLLGEDGPMKLFHCTCDSCGTAVIAVAIEISGSMNSVGLVTDLGASETLKFRHAPAVTSEECIATHRTMELESPAFCAKLLDKNRKKS